MKILSGAQIREADAYAISHEPITSEALMERAAKAFTDEFVKFYPDSLDIIVFCGHGNNGGDGLAIARMLLDRNYRVDVCIVKTGNNYSKDFLVNHERLSRMTTAQISDLEEISALPDIEQDAIVIDAIFGTGLSRPTEGLAASVIDAINDMNCEVVSVDMPSGLYTDIENPKKNSIIKASKTYTFQLPKLSFFFCSNADYTGDWQVLDIGLDTEFIENQETRNFFTDGSDANALLKERLKCSHKGTYGHALIWAGSYGKMGAAQLCAHACLNAGAGLTTAYIPECGYVIFQTALPEVMASTDPDELRLTGFPDISKYAALGIGPGIDTGLSTAKALLDLLHEAKDIPVVIDADALNILGTNKKALLKLPKHSVLTPHPKEFERLTGPAESDWQKQEMASAFAKEFNCVLVLKGTYTSVNLPNGETWFNTTGNPGMAKGGSGDALTGIITGLLAQKYSPEEAAIMGVYLHGLAGDFAAAQYSEWSMRASDLIDSLGDAFLNVQMS